MQGSIPRSLQTTSVRSITCRTLLTLGFVLVCTVSLTSCREQKWEVSKRARAQDYTVAAALGDLGHGTIRDLDAADVPELEAPAGLRPCCAFGADLKVKLGAVPVPGVELGNIVSLEDIGPHVYDNGLVSVNAADNRGPVDDEKNGLVYTCRGGFVDVAHIRDNADLTMFLVMALGRIMDEGGEIALPDQGGRVTVRVEPVSPETLRRHGRKLIATRAAQWVAYQMSIWHEIATWYGHSSIELWPEKISAFSPEDLYSNMIGVKIAGGITMNSQAASEDTYNHSMDAWIDRVLDRLQALPARQQSVDAMMLVDGLWWDSGRRIPDWKLTKRRHMEIGTEVHPWLVPDATGIDPDDAAAFDACDGAGEPLVLRNPGGFEGVEFSTPLTVEIDLDDKLAAVFPLPRSPSRIVTQADFPTVVEAIRRENAAEMGDDADRP